MRVLAISIALTACWRGAEPAPTGPSPAKPRPIEDIALPCESFDPANPNCETTCLPGAPDDWPGCIIARDRLIARGYTCTGPGVLACVPPPPPPPPPCNPCVPLTARIIATQISGSDVLITIAAGSDQGITKVWQADIVDAPSQGKRVAGGAVAIIRIDKQVTIGSVALTPMLLRATPYVYLRP